MASARALIVAASDDRRAVLSGAARAAGFAVEALARSDDARVPLSDPAVGALLLDLADPTLDRTLLATALAPATPAEPDSLADAERRHIARVLEWTGGNRRQAATILGISRSTLLLKLRRYGLDGALVAALLTLLAQS